MKAPKTKSVETNGVPATLLEELCSFILRVNPDEKALTWTTTEHQNVASVVQSLDDFFVKQLMATRTGSRVSVTTYHSAREDFVFAVQTAVDFLGFWKESFSIDFNDFDDTGALVEEIRQAWDNWVATLYPETPAFLREQIVERFKHNKPYVVSALERMIVNDSVQTYYKNIVLSIMSLSGSVDGSIGETVGRWLATGKTKQPDELAKQLLERVLCPKP